MAAFTFVSAYFELNPSQTNTYFQHFKRLVSLGFPIILFLDSKLEYRKYELEDTNVRIEIMDWDLFPINQYRSSHGLLSPLEQPRHFSETKDTEQYMTLMNTKPFFLVQASHLCAFETYVWIDFGILKLTQDLEHVRANFSKLKQYSKIVIPGGFQSKGLLSDEQLMSHVHWRFCGGIVICPKQHIESFFHSTFQELVALVSKRKITWELNLWANVEARHPELIQYYSADCNPKIFGFYDQKIVLVHEITEPIQDIPGFQTWVRDTIRTGDFQAACFMPKTDAARRGLDEIVASLRMSLIPAAIVSDFAAFCNEVGWDANYTYGCVLNSVGMKVVRSVPLPKLTAGIYKLTHVYNDTESCVSTMFQLTNDSSTIGYLPKSISSIMATSYPYVACPHYRLAMNDFTKGQWKLAIQKFKQSIRGGALSDDELWCAHYRIAQAWRALGNDLKMESWIHSAYQLKKTRAEPIYLACNVFRERGQNFKAYHYYLLGKRILRPNDSESYCTEPAIYAYKFDYESTILHYWIYSSDTDRIKGLIDILRYLNKTEFGNRNVLSNMDYYLPRLGNYGTIYKLGVSETDDHYAPSSASILEWNGRLLVNVRYVNYRIQLNGSYMMYDNGTYNNANNIKTRNALVYLDNKGECSAPTFLNLQLTDIPKLDSGIRGVEDVRLFTFQNQLIYTATTREYSYKQDTNRILLGTCDTDKLCFSNNRILRPPTETACEKNWIPINHCDEKILFIYGWHPLQIGDIDADGKLHICINHPTPTFWKHYRGSSTFLTHNDQLWCITHGVKEGSPRRYYHQFVALDKNTYVPLRYSIPFFFMDYKIEYCVGFIKTDNQFLCIFSRNDKDPYILYINTSAVDPLMISI
jgi:hypothetical protein